jgi:hypothetical protein
MGSFIMAGKAAHSSKTDEDWTLFEKRLEADVELASRYQNMEKELQRLADEEIRRTETMERLTSDDFRVYINARSDSSIDDAD